MKRILLTAFIASMVSFAWGQLSTPFSEDFESGTVGQAPSGWTIYHDNAGDSNADIWGVYMYGTNKMIRMNNSVAKSDVTWITMPAISLPAGQTSFFTFSYTHNAGGMPAIVFKTRISTDNGATFTDLNTYQKGTESDESDPGTMQNASVNLQAYAGQTVVLQFYATANWGFGAIFVDDVFVGPVQSCYAPSAVSVSNVTSSSASFVWTASGHGETQYEWVCVASGTAVDWTDATSTTATTASVTGLNSNTTYNFYVRSYCSASDQSQAASQAFHTDCEAVSLSTLGMIGFEQTEGFVAGAGNMANCWTVGNRQIADEEYIPMVYAQNAFAGSCCLKLKAFRSTSTDADSAYAILPEITFDNITDYHMQMQVRKIENFVGVADYSDTLWVGIVPSAASGLTGLQIVGYAVSTNTSYVAADVSLAGYTGGTTGYVVLLAATDKRASLNTRYAQFYVDNLVIRKNTSCTLPADVTISAVTTTSAQVNWNGTAANYNIYVAGERVQNPEAYTSWLTTTTSSTNSKTLSGLTPATDYYVYVQAVCSQSSQSDITSEAASFTTECLPVTALPWSEDFEDATVNAVPHCWTPNTFKGFIQVQNNAGEAHHGSKYLSLFGGNDFYGTVVMVLPTISVDLNGTQLSFWAKQSGTTDNHPALEIGVMSNPNDTNTFRTIYTVPKSKTYEQYDVPVTAPAGYSYLAMRLRTSATAAEEKSAAASVSIDEMVLSTKPSCVKPGIPAVSQVAAESATLAWSGTAASYYVKVMSGTDVLAETTTTATTLLLSDLTPATAYTIDVRMVAHCNDTCSSDTLSKVLQFTTECKAISVFPYREDFDYNPVATVPACWDNSADVAESQKWRIYDDNGNQCLRFNSQTVADGDTALIISPEFILPADAKNLFFDWKNPSGGNLDVFVQIAGGKRTSVASALKSQSTWKTETVSLASYTNKTVVFVFRGTSNYGGNTAYLYLDNIIVQGQNDVFTSVENNSQERNIRKVLLDGVLYIEVDGVRYDVRGQRVR